MRNDKRNEWLFELIYLTDSMLRFFAVFARCLTANRKKFCKSIAQLYRKGLSPVFFVIGTVLSAIGGFFAKGFGAAAHVFTKYFGAVGILCEDIGMLWRTGHSLSFGKRVGRVLRYLAGPAKQRKQLALTFVNYAMPAIALVIAVNMISGLLDTNYAFAVTYNGVELGYIEDQTVYSAAAKDMQKRIIVPEDGEVVPVDAKLSLRKLSSEDEVVSSAELTNRMMQNANQDIVEADGIYIDGKFMGAVEEIGVIEAYLNDTINAYLLETGYDTAYFDKDIVVEKGFFVADNLIKAEEVLELFASEISSDQYYTVEVGDTPIGIAAKLEIDYHDLITWNPGSDKLLIAGDEILVGVSQPYLSIIATTTDVYTEEIAYKTEKEETSTLYVGERKIKKEGKIGEQTVTAEVTLVNGIETERTVLSTEVVEEAENEILLVGTKEHAPSYVPSGIVTTGGTNETGIWLSWPTQGGYISSAYGSRWGSFHRAIDIAKRGGCHGDRIFAAADGKVTYVGYNGTYGKLIKISHGNGLETWYAHCSDYNVSTGDTVSRGETIGYIGNTGRSTGPHLHFQVMLYGNYVNPVNYMK